MREIFTMRRVVLLTMIASLLIMVAPLQSLTLPANADKTSTPLPPLKLKVGDEAPDFTLKNQDGKDVSLHDFHGKKTVVLAFYIFAFSGG